MKQALKRRPGRPKDEDLCSRRREQILDAASHVFAANSYRNTDLQFIADRLRLSKASIYRYFDSKEKLFLAAVDRGVDRMHEYITASEAGETDALARLTRAVYGYLAFYRANPHLTELLIQERVEFKDRKEPSYFVHREQCLEPWREAFRGLIAEGRIRRIPVDRILDVLGDLLYGTMVTNHFVNRRRPHEDQARDIVDIFFNGILTDQEKARRGAG
jgi:AcrR family transcriptional regulator